jgi:hypothetical protein
MDELSEVSSFAAYSRNVLLPGVLEPDDVLHFAS